MAGREQAMVGGRHETGAAGPSADRMRPRGLPDAAWPGSERDTLPGETAYPDTPRSHRRQPVASVAPLKPARAVTRATPTTPERVSGYMEQSISC
jgi:hypothetical protein